MIQKHYSYLAETWTKKLVTLILHSRIGMGDSTSPTYIKYFIVKYVVVFSYSFLLDLTESLCGCWRLMRATAMFKWVNPLTLIIFGYIGHVKLISTICNDKWEITPVSNGNKPFEKQCTSVINFCPNYIIQGKFLEFYSEEQILMFGLILYNFMNALLQNFVNVITLYVPYVLNSIKSIYLLLTVEHESCWRQLSLDDFRLDVVTCCH